MPFQVLQVIPVLRIFDVEKAKEFYVGFLGFTVDWEHTFEANFPVNMQVSRGVCTFHLPEHHGDGSPGANVFIRMTGLDEFHKEVSSRGYKHMNPWLEETFHGTKAMGVIEPFGNRSISTKTSSRPTKPRRSTTYRSVALAVQAEAERRTMPRPISAIVGDPSEGRCRSTPQNFTSAILRRS